MNRSALLQTIIIVFIIASFSACSKSGSNPAPKNDDSKVVITSLSVTSGHYTTNVIIEGNGFSTTATDNHVQFNGKDAVVQLASATKLYTTVPLAAGTGNVTVTVNNVKANGPVLLTRLRWL